MKIVKPGRLQKGWAKEYCAGDSLYQKEANHE